MKHDRDVLKILKRLHLKSFSVHRRPWIFVATTHLFVLHFDPLNDSSLCSSLRWIPPLRWIILFIFFSVLFYLIIILFIFCFLYLIFIFLFLFISISSLIDFSLRFYRTQLEVTTSSLMLLTVLSSLDVKDESLSCLVSSVFFFQAFFPFLFLFIFIFFGLSSPYKSY